MKFAFASACFLISTGAFGLGQSAQDLSGTEWKSPFLGDPQSAEVQYSFKFTSTTELRQIFRFHSVSPIGNSAFVMTHYATYTVGAAVPGPANAQAFDLTSIRMTQTPLDDSIVESFNHSGECGFHDWAVGVAKDVTGIVCEPGDQPIHAGDKFFDILVIDGTRLQTGLIPDGGTVGTSPDSRPTAVDPNVVYERVSP